MTKISVYDKDGRTRDERETCFPLTGKNGAKNVEIRGQVRDDG